MKKFIVLSLLVAIAGIAFGVIRRQEPSAAAVVATESSTASSSTVTTVTTAKPAVAAKVTTTTRPRAAGIAATTTTTRPVAASSPTTTAAPTTTTTVAAPQQITPMCSTSATPATAGSYIGGGTWEDVRIASNMPKTRARLIVQYPTLKQQFWLETDAGGAAKKIFQLRDSGTTSLSVDFYDAAENHVGGSPACQSTFEAPRPA